MLYQSTLLPGQIALIHVQSEENPRFTQCGISITGWRRLNPKKHKATCARCTRHLKREKQTHPLQTQSLTPLQEKTLLVLYLIHLIKPYVWSIGLKDITVTKLTRRGFIIVSKDKHSPQVRISALGREAAEEIIKLRRQPA